MNALPMPPEIGKNSKNPKLPSLTGMRFVAAFIVFIFHAIVEQRPFAETGVQDALAKIVNQSGYMGVGFFFVLSGFVLTWSARPSDTVIQFWRRRFWKIYPNHIVTAIAALLLLVYVVKIAVPISYDPLNLLLIQSWFPSLAVRGSLNGVTWSLSCEVLFYFLFPFLLIAIRRIRPERLWWWTIGTAAAAFAMPGVAQLLPPSPMLPLVNIPAFQFWWIYQFPPVRLLDFVFGILLARIVLTGQRLPIRFGGAVVLTVICYTIATYLPASYSMVAVCFIPVGLLVATTGVADRDGRRTWLSGRVVVALGEISYAFYLWHRLVLEGGHVLLGATRQWSTPEAVGMLVAALAVALVLSWLLYSFVERPLMRRFAYPRMRKAEKERVALPSLRSPRARGQSGRPWCCGDLADSPPPRCPGRRASSCPARRRWPVGDAPIGPGPAAVIVRRLRLR